MNLMPLLACTQLEALECSRFNGIDAQAYQLFQACPDLDIFGCDDNYDGEDDGEEEDWEVEGGGYWDGLSDLEKLELAAYGLHG